MPQLTIKRIPDETLPDLHIWHVFRYGELIGKIVRPRNAPHEAQPYKAYLMNGNRAKLIGTFSQKDGRNRAIRLIGVFANRKP